MKSYSFYFNASDWLASPAVKLMSKAERGVYINLLATAWQAAQQGTLPASADKVRRLAEMSVEEWAESGEVLLEKFPLSECGTYRYNPRLVAEASKEQARSEKAKASAEKRWQNKPDAKAMPTQSERNANASEIDANASENACDGNAIVKESKVKKEDKSSSTPSLRSARAAKAEPEHFPSFWQAYPRKESRATALKAFEKLTEEEQARAAQHARDWFGRRAPAEWYGADGTDYRPHPTTWLNQKRWTDLTEITITPTGFAPQPFAQHGNPQHHALNTQLVNDDKRAAAFTILAQLGL